MIELKYSNDLQLTELVRQLNRDMAPFNHFLRNGQLSTAFLYAMEFERVARAIQIRLNEIRFPKK